MQPKKPNTLWIVLGICGGLLLAVIGVCCGVAFWLTSFPGVTPNASQPFEYGSIAVPTFPESVPSKTFPGIGNRTEVVFGNGGGFGNPPGSNSRLWVYTPQGKFEKQSLPCVLICGAGSTMLTGMELGEGDEAEHLPYVKAGFAVVAYDLDGGNESDAPEASSYEAFRDSQAGLVNARIAMEYVINKIPEINPKNIFVAGHSSAGATALLFAEHEPRIAGCVAFAPCTDLQSRLPAIVIRTLSTTFSGLADFVVKSSPRTHEQKLNCPLMLFHAADDSNVPIQESRDFVKRLKDAGKIATLLEVPTGDHYQPMIDTGIPAGINWMKSQIK